MEVHITKKKKIWRGSRKKFGGRSKKRKKQTWGRGALKKTAPNGLDPRNHGHGNTMTDSAQWGQFSGTRSEAHDLVLAAARVWGVFLYKLKKWKKNY